MFVTQHQYSYGHLQILTEQHKIWVTQRIHFQLRLNKAILLPSCFSSHTANVCCFCGLFSTIFFAFWCFSPPVISLFKMALKNIAEIFSGFSKVSANYYVPYRENTCGLISFTSVLLSLSSLLMKVNNIFK